MEMGFLLPPSLPAVIKGNVPTRSARSSRSLLYAEERAKGYHEQFRRSLQQFPWVQTMELTCLVVALTARVKLPWSSPDGELARSLPAPA